MRRVLLLVAVAAVSMLAFGGVAQAQDPPAPDQTLPPTFQPPGPAPVTDVASAEAFATSYATRNAWRFLRESPRRVRVVDAAARCLAHPVVADRYGCVFTLRALVIQRRHGWHGYHAVKSGPPQASAACPHPQLRLPRRADRDWRPDAAGHRSLRRVRPRAARRSRRARAGRVVRRSSLAAVAALLIPAGTAFATDPPGGDEGYTREPGKPKVTICHVAGNPDATPRTLEVRPRAAARHL